MRRTPRTAGQRGRPGLIIVLLVAGLALTSAVPVLGTVEPVQASPVASAATPWMPPSPSYRIRLAADGLYSLDYSYLSTAGLPVDLIDPSTFRMFYMGQEIAIRVVGEGDGVFGPGDAVLFYGRGVDSLFYDGLLPTNKYTGTNVFWLSYGGPPGRRMAERDGSGAGTTPSSFLQREILGRNYWYFTKYPFQHDADHFFADWIRPAGTAPASRTYSFVAANVYGGPSIGTLKVNMLGYRDGPHHLRLYVNNNLVLDGSPTWQGFTIYTVQVDVPQAYFRNGTNDIRIEMVNDPPKTSDEVYVDYADVSYHDAFVAESSVLRFTNKDGGGWRYGVSNFATADIEVYDVTDLADVQIFGGTEISGAGPYAVAFGDTTAGLRRYAALNPSARLAPTGIELVTYPASSYSAPDLLRTANAADYIIVTHASFWTDAERLAAWRARDFRVLLVDAQQIYDQFNGGVMSAESIHDFLAHAYTTWTVQPQYVVLLGDGSYDMRNYRYSAPTYIPPYLYLADPDMGETAADNRFVTITGADNMPEMHLGRLPANSAAEAKAMVDKIIAYEDPRQCSCNRWNYNTLFVADDLEGGGGDFYAYSDEVAEGYVDPPANTVRFVPQPPYTVTKAYLGRTCDIEGNPDPAIECPNVIVSTLNTVGALFVSFVGHAAKFEWAVEGLMNEPLLKTLTNGPCLPIMLPMTCFEGSYHDPVTVSVAESAVRLPVHGAVASWSPTGFGLVTGHDYLEKGVVLALLHENVERLGPATTRGKQYLLDNAPAGAYRDLLDTYGLIGDPGLQVKTKYVCELIPTAVRMVSFGARRAPGGVLVSWQTENETDMLGFRVLRRADGESAFEAASREPIFAAHSGAGGGSAYTFLDQQVQRSGTTHYVLEILKLDGTSERYGRAEVTARTAPLYLPLVQSR